MLTPSQLVTLAAAIRANPDPTVVDALAGGADGVISDWYNQPSSFVAWNSRTPVQAIADAIQWSHLTPNDQPDSTNDGTQLYANKMALYSARALLAQAKQLNLQMLLTVSTGYINATLANVRAGFQDCLTNLPTNTGGATWAAGWVSVQTAMQRYANNVEKVFATGTGTSATPGLLTFEGTITPTDIASALRPQG